MAAKTVDREHNEESRALQNKNGSAKTPQHEADFVLQKVQPGLLGLMDGSVSTLAPLFAAAGLTHDAHKAFYVGLAASVGAGISMGLAEALSDDGSVTGRGNPWIRGVITGLATTLGGMLHTLPFLIPNLGMALNVAYGVVVFELLMIAYIRCHFMKTPLAATIGQVIVGGGIVFAIGLWLGKLGAGG
jgi:VIT1/CCC1 family predicted Fe2+/Mn2+ transporter